MRLSYPIMERQRAISKLADTIFRIRLDHPVRIGIDGVDASGKTMLANELVKPIQEKGRDAIRISIDRFHNPKEIRYRKGRNSPEGYYEDSFNHEAIISHALEPLGPTGDLKYKPECFDFVSNSEIRCLHLNANKDSILLFDGVFLHRPQLLSYWDFTVFVHASFDTTIKRAQKRDLHLFGTSERLYEMYSQRYIPGQRIYLETAVPEEKANAIFYNDDIGNPELIFH